MELERVCSQESFGNYIHKAGKADFENDFFFYSGLGIDRLNSGRFNKYCILPRKEDTSYLYKLFQYICIPDVTQLHNNGS